MAAEDEQRPDPNLELPGLFGRRRKTTDDGDTQVFAETETAFTDEQAVFADAGSDVPQPAAQDGDSDQTADPTADQTAVLTTTARRRAARPSRPRPGLPSLPAIPPVALPPVAGLLTGASLLALVWLGRRGCEAINGTQSCGAGPGLAALVVIFAATVVIGRVLLGLLKVTAPGMTSFLAVGLTSLVAALLLGDLLDSPAIVVVLPLVCAAAFAASSWLANVQVDLDD